MQALVNCFSDSIHDHLGKLIDEDVLIINQLWVAYNLVDFPFAHALSHCHHSMLEVLHRDLSVVVRVENFERIDQILQRLLVLSAVTYDLLDILTREKSSLLRVDLLRHILDLSLGRVEVERPHEVS